MTNQNALLPEREVFSTVFINFMKTVFVFNPGWMVAIWIASLLWLPAAKGISIVFGLITLLDLMPLLFVIVGAPFVIYGALTGKTEQTPKDVLWMLGSSIFRIGISAVDVYLGYFLYTALWAD
jgi:hypothetical protein